MALSHSPGIVHLSCLVFTRSTERWSQQLIQKKNMSKYSIDFDIDNIKIQSLYIVSAAAAAESHRL